MSWYTYFYPKLEDYIQGETVNAMKVRLAKCKQNCALFKRGFMVSAIRAYYDQPTVFHNMDYNWRVLVKFLQEKEEIETALWVKEQLDTYKSVGINHAECDSKEDLQDAIDKCNEYTNSLLDEGIYYTCFKNSNVAEEFDKEITYFLEDFIPYYEDLYARLEENIADLYHQKFMLDNFDTKKEENEE